MSEGVTHVQERNEQWAANDVVAAWRENRILEKYYGPVLDSPSYVSRTGHRWSAEQRADAEARQRGAQGPSNPGPYASAANPYPIYSWPRVWFWAMALAVAAAILTLTSAYRFLPPLRIGS